jgi:putative oxygen-independent coproporphyrinogen III oxidase
MHLYIHVPFCARRCSYCDFAIAVRRQVPSAAYVSAVLREWALWQRDPVWDGSPEIETVYFGGGTPSRLAADAIASLLKGVRRDRRVGPGAEVTLEANPDDVTAESATAWHDAGVNRVSLGVQSFDPRVLEWMHRTHTADQVPQAVELLRRAGIDNLSLDLIFGVPAQLERDWSFDLGAAFDLQPEHLSLYGLTVEPLTPLGRWAQRGEVAPLDEERYALEFLEAHAALESHGYQHYEVSNAARPGHRARHNSSYWTRVSFIGLGPAAHSGFGAERRWNVREWAQYERVIAAGQSPRESRELLDVEAIELEELYLGLRTTEGIARERVPGEDLDRWLTAGWARLDGARLILTPEGWLRLDALVASVGLVHR